MDNKVYKKSNYYDIEVCVRVCVCVFSKIYNPVLYNKSQKSSSLKPSSEYLWKDQSLVSVRVCFNILKFTFSPLILWRFQKENLSRLGFK